jgi:gamma-glutamyl-gamma-aminobutyrate hydrolase PuuD
VAHVAVTKDGNGEVREPHLIALRAAGVEPVLVSDTIGDCQAVYLPGTDYVPSLPGEDAEAEAAKVGLPWDPIKVYNDLAVLAEAKTRGLPLLGVCGGMQAMVVFAGGTLRAGEGHAELESGVEVELAPGSLAAHVFGERTAANSFHRQVVDDIGALTPSGWSGGVVEAVEGEGFWLGVQWHPERLNDLRPYDALASQT